MEDKRFLTAADVSEIMGCGIGKSYSIIRELNQELKSKGYIVVSGKINTKYFNERVYDGVGRDYGD